MCRLTAVSEACRSDDESGAGLGRRSLDHFLDAQPDTEGQTPPSGEILSPEDKILIIPTQKPSLTSEINNLIKWNKEKSRNSDFELHKPVHREASDPTLIVPIIEPFPSKKLILANTEASKFGLLKKNVFEKPLLSQEKDKSGAPPSLLEISNKIDTTISSQQFIISLVLQQNYKLGAQIDSLKKEVLNLSYEPLTQENARRETRAPDCLNPKPERRRLEARRKNRNSQQILFP